jgi:hypothetical protein
MEHEAIVLHLQSHMESSHRRVNQSADIRDLAGLALLANVTQKARHIGRGEFPVESDGVLGSTEMVPCERR